MEKLNELIDDALETFDIKRSLSAKGNPYDNAVTEATFKLFKTEFMVCLAILVQSSTNLLPLKKLFSLVLTFHF